MGTVKRAGQIKMIRLLVIVSFSFTLMSCAHGKAAGGLKSYEEVGAKAPEVFDAAVSILEPKGFRVRDDKNYVLETDWIEDSVMREKSQYFFKTKIRYLRQYRYRLTLKPWPRYTEITVQTYLRYKHASASPQTVWRSLKSDRQDYELGRDLFRSILAEMERRRANA